VPKKVFISFDFDNDRVLKDFIIGQARNADSPFEVSDHSLKEAGPEAGWLNLARAAITRADVIITMLGPSTRYAAGVQKEIGYQNGNEEWAVPEGGRTYVWSWDTLKRLLA
jgi:hypothetical protein